VIEVKEIEMEMS